MHGCLRTAGSTRRRPQPASATPRTTTSAATIEVQAHSIIPQTAWTAAAGATCLIAVPSPSIGSLASNGCSRRSSARSLCRALGTATPSGDYATGQKAGVVLTGPAGWKTGAGGVPRGSVRRLAERKDHFIGEYKGILGLWKRAGRKLWLVNAFKDRVNYKARFDFFGVFERTASRQLPERFKEAWDKLKP